jgi:hypothetical protein
MGPDTAPAKRLQKIGHSNVLVDCLMKLLSGKVPENTAGIKGRGRQMVVNKPLKWNTGRESQMIRWKEAESKSMEYENLQWRRELISDTVAKVRGLSIARGLSIDCTNIVKKFGTSSTVFMTTSEAKRGLERTISHTSTRVSTRAKVAARKIRGGRIRGMKVLAHMNTARWVHMDTADRVKAIQCPCQCGIQNIEHVLTGECEYTAVCLDEMIDTVDCALCSETAAQSVEEKVRAIVGMEVRGVSPDALSGVASALRLLVRSTETALRTMNMAGESWPVDSLAVWAPEEDGPQFELHVEVMSVGDQQMEAA